MKNLTPSFKSWVAGDCKWVVGFPTGRRYFKTEQLALDENARAADAALLFLRLDLL